MFQEAMIVVQKKTRVSDEKIIDTLEKHKVLTEPEIEDLLKYSHGSLRSRLHRLVMENKIKSRLLPHRAHTGVCVVFRGYAGVAAYYVNDDDFIEWIKSKIPRNLPKNIRRIITMKLHEMKIDLNISPRTDLMMVGVKPHIHNKLKKTAEREKKSIQKITEEALLSYIDG